MHPSASRFRDLTIRAKRESGTKTELDKIKEGFGDYCFYGLTEGDEIIDWILVDLEKLRQGGLLNRQRNLIPSPGGTYFIAIPQKELAEHGCIVVSAGGYY